MATHSSSCLENPRDGGAWWAAVSGVTQSWTRLKRLSSSSSSSSNPSAFLILLARVHCSPCVGYKCVTYLLIVCFIYKNACSLNVRTSWCMSSITVFSTPGKVFRIWLTGETIEIGYVFSATKALCDSMDYSPPDCSVLGFPARLLELVAISSSSGSSWPRDWTQVSYISCIGREFCTTEPIGKPLQQGNR